MSLWPPPSCMIKECRSWKYGGISVCYGHSTPVSLHWTLHSVYLIMTQLLNTSINIVINARFCIIFKILPRMVWYRSTLTQFILNYIYFAIIYHNFSINSGFIIFYMNIWKVMFYYLLFSFNFTSSNMHVYIFHIYFFNFNSAS